VASRYLDADIKLAGLIRWRWWQESPITKETTKEIVKTIRAGMPGCFGEPAVTNSACFLYLHPRLWAR
jgi:hypothetical protein